MTCPMCERADATRETGLCRECTRECNENEPRECASEHDPVVWEGGPGEPFIG